MAFGLAAAGFGFGVAGAWFWYRSTQVDLQRPQPVLNDPLEFEPVAPELKQLWADVRQMTAIEANRNALVEANRETGRLNKIAAALTGAAVLLSTLSTVIG